MTPPNPLAYQLRWLIGIRLIVVSSVFLLHFLIEMTGETVGLRYMYPLAGVMYLASLVYIILLSVLKDRLILQGYLQFLGDLLFVTALCYLNGPISPFATLYLVVISVAATLLRRSAGMNIAQLAWLIYAAMLVGIFYGVIPAPHDQPLPSVKLLTYNLFSTLLGFAGVALLTSYLARDATRVRAELVVATTSLEELEDLHRDVIESITSGLITTDLSGRIVSVNRAGREILGCMDQDLIGTLIHESGLFTAETWGHLTGNLGVRIRDEGEVQRKNRRLWVGYSVSELCASDGGRRGFIVTFQDLTDWRKLQEEVQMKDRMAAVGELAAGIAHEIGNPLAAISGSVQMLHKRDGDVVTNSRLLDIILQESRRLDRTIKGFLQFAKPKTDSSSVHFDIGQLLTENLTLLRNSEEITEEHEVELALDPPSAKLVGDPDQISQIFWNLTRNSIRAMPKGGTLRVEGSLSEDSYRIRFVDTGRGMTEKERSNLFHPFRSFFDGGTGIGMAIVYRIVQDHGGRISVESAPNAGTAVAVELPVARKETAPVEASVV
jgi:two-component system sensor histidine kinase PilS (NtrC family)